MLLDTRLKQTFERIANSLAQELISELLDQGLVTSEVVERNKEAFLNKAREVLNHYKVQENLSEKELLESLKDSDTSNAIYQHFFGSLADTSPEVEVVQHTSGDAKKEFSKMVREYLGSQSYENNLEKINGKILEVISTYENMEDPSTLEELVVVFQRDPNQLRRVLHHFFGDLKTKSSNQEFNLKTSIRDYLFKTGLISPDAFAQKRNYIEKMIEASANELKKKNSEEDLKKYFSRSYHDKEDKIYLFLDYVFKGINIKEVYETEDLVEKLEEVLREVYGVDSDDYLDKKDQVMSALKELAETLVEKRGNSDEVYGELSSLKYSPNTALGQYILKTFRKYFPSILISKHALPLQDEVEQEDPKDYLRNYIRDMLNRLTSQDKSYDLLEDQIEYLLIDPMFREIKTQYRRNNDALISELSSPSPSREARIQTALERLVESANLPKRVKVSRDQEEHELMGKLVPLFTKMYEDLGPLVDTLNLDPDLGPTKLKVFKDRILIPLIQELLNKDSFQSIVNNLQTNPKQILGVLKQRLVDFVTSSESEPSEIRGIDSYNKIRENIVNDLEVVNLDRQPAENSVANEIAMSVEQKTKSIKTDPEKYDSYKEKARELIEKSIYPREDFFQGQLKAVLDDAGIFVGIEDQLKGLKLDFTKPIDQISERDLVSYVASNWNANQNVDPSNPFQDTRWWKDLTPNEKGKAVTDFKRRNQSVISMSSTGIPELDKRLEAKIKPDELIQIVKQIESKYTRQVNQNINYFATNEIKNDARKLVEENLNKSIHRYLYYVYKGHVILPWEALDILEEDRSQRLYHDNDLQQLIGMTEQQLNQLVTGGVEREVEEYNDKLSETWTDRLVEIEKRQQDSDLLIKQMREKKQAFPLGQIDMNRYLDSDLSEDAFDYENILRDMEEKDKKLRRKELREVEKIKKLMRDYPKYKDRRGLAQTNNNIGLYYDVPEQLKGSFKSLKDLGMTERNIDSKILQKIKESGEELDFSRIYKKEGKGKLSDDQKALLKPVTFKGQVELDKDNIVWVPQEGWVGSSKGLERSFAVTEYSVAPDIGINERLYDPYTPDKE